MIRLLKFLFTGDWHLHQWEQLQKTYLMDPESITGRHVGVRYDLKCKHCGNIKFVAT